MLLTIRVINKWIELGEETKEERRLGSKKEGNRRKKIEIVYRKIKIVFEHFCAYCALTIWSKKSLNILRVCREEQANNKYLHWIGCVPTRVSYHYCNSQWNSTWHWIYPVSPYLSRNSAVAVPGGSLDYSNSCEMGYLTFDIGFG